MPWNCRKSMHEVLEAAGWVGNQRIASAGVGDSCCGCSVGTAVHQKRAEDIRNRMERKTANLPEIRAGFWIPWTKIGQFRGGICLDIAFSWYGKLALSVVPHLVTISDPNSVCQSEPIPPGPPSWLADSKPLSLLATAGGCTMPG